LITSRAAVLLLTLALCLTGTSAQTTPPPPPAPQAAEVYFSPHGGCTEAVVRELGKAKKTIFVQAYSFTSKPIAAALVAASKRGVAVTLILDDSDKTGNGTMIDVVAAGGDVVLIDAKHAIAHNKVMVIDTAVVLTGSFNFTAAAENSNAENLLVLRSPALAAEYTANWHVHEAHSKNYVPPTTSSRRK
jgi:phosphatidylserine/phosphatidylglycerophosphate/cardiolipin synthase-like enzyme